MLHITTVLTLSVPCTECGAAAGEPCTANRRSRGAVQREAREQPHRDRRVAYRRLTRVSLAERLREQRAEERQIITRFHESHPTR